MISCNKEKDLSSIISEDKSNEYDVAIDLVKNFINQRKQVSTYSTKLDLSEIIVLKVDETTYSFDIDECILNDNSSDYKNSSVDNPLNSVNMTDVKLFTVTFEKNGKTGYAISSGDERITNVYAYTESGSISDTSHILGLKAAIYEIRGAVKADLDCYYQFGRNIRLDTNIPIIPRLDPSESSEYSKVSTRSTQVTIPGRLIVNQLTKLQWDQWCPFNNLVSVSCTDNGYTCGKAPAGCSAIACAQAIAYLCPPAINSSYYLSDLRLIPIFIIGNLYQPWSSNLAGFVRNVGTMVNTSYSCSTSSGSIKNIRDEFNSWSVYYSYVDGNFEMGRVAYNVWSGFPHITRGVSKSPDSGAHAWLWEGIDCYVTAVNHSTRKYTISGSALVYCNWGWGPNNSNGWFANWEEVYTGSGKHYRYINDNEQIYITGTGFIVPPN